MKDGFYKLPTELNDDTCKYPCEYLYIYEDRAYHFGVNRYGMRILEDLWTQIDMTQIDIMPLGSWVYKVETLVKEYPPKDRDIARELLSAPLEYICGPTRGEFYIHFKSLIEELQLQSI